jgi:uncharacterized membrane protein YccC
VDGTSRLSPGELWQDWLQSHGPKWIFVTKTLFAGFMALWISFRFGFDKPATAMMTVFIVAQPQSGLVIAKSFYRLLGTLVGSVATWLLVATLAQERELFILAMSLWIGVCVAGAARFREFQAYAFVLAGYSSCIIGFPAVMQPSAFFDIAQSRISEIMLGILCAAVISDAVFPQRLAQRMVATLRGQFSNLVGFVQKAVAGPLDRTVTINDQLRFVADVLTLESLRASSIFESPDSRIRDDRLRLFNADFMTVSTTLHAIQQLAQRLREQSREQALTALRPCVASFAPQLLLDDGRIVSMAAEAPLLMARLDRLLPELKTQLQAARATLADKVEAEELLDFDCAAELVEDFAQELLTLTQTYASLALPSGRPARRAPAFIPHSELSEAVLAGVRATAAMLVVMLFWIATAWPNGATAATLACIACALFAAAPAPVQAVKQMGKGFVLGFFLGMVCKFGVLPQADTFLEMCLAFTPFLTVGVLLMTQPATAGMGAGCNLMLISAVVPENLMHYDLVGYINDGSAQLLGLAIAGIAFVLLAHKTPDNIHRHIAGRLRRELLRVCDGSLQRLPHAFESRVRDLMRSVMGLPADQRSELAMCALSVLEIGDAISDLRHLSRELPAGMSRDMTSLLRQLGRSFADATEAERQPSISALKAAIATLATQLESHTLSLPRQQAAARLQRCLHRIYSVLGDDSWFAAFSSDGQRADPDVRPEESLHAT